MMIETSHLNAFIHPCLEAALWHIAKINYEFGEIPSPNYMNWDCADGVRHMMTACPAAKEEKEIADAKKIAQNLKKKFLSIIKENIGNQSISHIIWLYLVGRASGFASTCFILNTVVCHLKLKCC
jgi:hypothetical protein